MIDALMDINNQKGWLEERVKDIPLSIEDIECSHSFLNKYRGCTLYCYI